MSGTNKKVYDVLRQGFVEVPEYELEFLGTFGNGPGSIPPSDETLDRATYIEPLTDPGEIVLANYFEKKDAI